MERLAGRLCEEARENNQIGCFHGMAGTKIVRPDEGNAMEWLV